MNSLSDTFCMFKDVMRYSCTQIDFLDLASSGCWVPTRRFRPYLSPMELELSMPDPDPSPKKDAHVLARARSDSRVGFGFSGLPRGHADLSRGGASRRVNPGATAESRRDNAMSASHRTFTDRSITRTRQRFGEGKGLPFLPSPLVIRDAECRPLPPPKLRGKRPVRQRRSSSVAALPRRRFSGERGPRRSA